MYTIKLLSMFDRGIRGELTCGDGRSLGELLTALGLKETGFDPSEQTTYYENTDTLLLAVVEPTLSPDSQD